MDNGGTSSLDNNKHGSYDFFIGKINILIFFSSSTMSISRSSIAPKTSKIASVNLSESSLTLNPSMSRLARLNTVVFALSADLSTVPNRILPSMWCFTSVISVNVLLWFLGLGGVLILRGDFGCNNCSPNKKKVTAAVIKINKYSFKCFRTITTVLW